MVMIEKRQLNVRIPVELYDKINSSDKANVELVIEALTLYFDRQKLTDDSYKAIMEENIQLRAELEHKKELIQMMQARVADLQNEVGFLQAEYRRITEKLLPAGKQWWQFWKK